ncbi:MAG: Tad secretion system protein [Idiomarinaceae bacterium HL-53]|nr:MAG: Tad secretion system protein [Idiomarinaceae bacterium HL-53]
MLGTLMIAGLVLGLIAITRLGFQSQQQLHTQAVANHAAEAVAILGARDLNFKSVTNRAMLANEVVVGQLMALQSWFLMAEDASERLALFTSWIPYVNGMTRGLSNAITQIKTPLLTAIDVGVQAQHYLIRTLEQAQFIFHQASWTSALHTMEQLVEASDPSYRVRLFNHQTLINTPGLWLSFQRRARADEYATWVNDSRDPFTRKRTYNWLSLLMVDIEKAGGTDISQTNSRVVWRSIDTLGVHVDILFGSQELRFGGGAGYINERLPENASRSEFGGSYRVNKRTSRKAANRAEQMRINRTVPYQYLLADPAQEFPNVTVVVVDEAPDNPPMDSTLKHIGIGRYQVRFERAAQFFPRRDGRHESANLFNGFWTVKENPIRTLDRRIIEAQLSL